MKRFVRYSAIVALFASATICLNAQEGALAKNVGATPSTDAAKEQKPVTAPSANSIGSSATTRVGIVSAEPISLSLDDAIRKALASNNDIEVSRDDVRFQETQVRSIQGFYDPVFSVTPTYTRNSSTGSAATSDFNVNAGLQGFVRPGG